MSPPSQPFFPLLRLPPELRDQIYTYLFHPPDFLNKSQELEEKGFYGGVYRFDLNVFKTCRQVYREAKRVWRRKVVCVKIGTPWGGAVNHVASEGLVPIVCADEAADAFTSPHALVQISTPSHHTVSSHTIVLLVDDLPLFTQTWFYSALSYPMLNDRLSTTFTLCAPSTDAADEQQGGVVALSLQRKLLLPFGQVKGLYSAIINNYSPDVEAEVRVQMSTPPPSLAQSIESAISHMSLGDTALSLSPPDAHLAQDHYTAAFHAIHILISHRTRRVLADSFFHASIPSGPYAGQTGMLVRVILRLKLVSRMIAALLLQGNYADALFWGMRSVRIMSESMDAAFERLLADLVGGDDVALVYVRAGIALWKMQSQPENEEWRDELNAYVGDDLADVEMLMRMAVKHLRRGMGGARAEVERYGLPGWCKGVFKDDDREPEESGATVAYEIHFDLGPLQ